MRGTCVSGVELFYRRLLDLSGPEDVPHVLRGAGGVLDILVRLTGAELAYLEVLGGGIELRVGHGAADGDADAVEPRISREILRLALSRIEEVTSPSALGDERFSTFEGVVRNQVRAVACVPVASLPGALYLQGQRPFSPVALDLTRLCARHVGEQLIQHQSRDERLPLHRATRMFKRRHLLAALSRAEWNCSRAARELGIARSNLYKLMALLDIQEQVMSSRPVGRTRPRTRPPKALPSA